MGISGKAYNISGNMGLQLEFTDGSRLLIGTNKPHELDKMLTDTGIETPRAIMWSTF